ncbi:MAG: hypothetical protein HY319_01245 [Armatimonadetes bacterium]|nr:hypothetical protein [Armatimonadota bacterium]
MKIHPVAGLRSTPPRPAARAPYEQEVPFGLGSIKLPFQPGPPPTAAQRAALERATGDPEAARDAARILSDYLSTRPKFAAVYRELLPKVRDPWDTLGVVRYFELRLGDHLTEARNLFLERLGRVHAESPWKIADKLITHEGYRHPNEDFVSFHRLTDEIDGSGGWMLLRDIAKWREPEVTLEQARQDYVKFEKSLPPQLAQSADGVFHDIADRPGQYGHGMGHTFDRVKILTGYAQAAQEAVAACPGITNDELWEAMSAAAGSESFALAVRLGAEGVHYAGEVYAWEQLSQWIADEAPGLADSFREQGLPWLKTMRGEGSLREGFDATCGLMKRFASGELDQRALERSFLELTSAGVEDGLARRAALEEQKLTPELVPAFRSALFLGTPPAQAVLLAREQMAATGKIVRSPEEVQVGTVTIPVRRIA